MRTHSLRPRAHAFSATVASGILTSSILAAGLHNELEAQTPEASDALRARVETYETVWNTHDPAAVAAFFTEDADMIMGNLPIARGRQVIQDWWGKYFAAIEPERKGTFEVVSLRLITPAVALINISSVTGNSDSEGRELPTRLARGTWVLVREADNWLISAMRGQPAEGDVRGPPPGFAPSPEDGL
jgi:uncharacterized protein (TIGR02246 family)